MKKVLLTLGLCSLLSLTACSNNIAIKDPNQLEHTISVYGQASEEIKPDVAHLHINVLVEDKESKTAQNKANKIMNSIYSNLKEMGIQKEDISTTNFEVDFIRDYTYQPIELKRGNSNELPNPIVGYRVLNQIKVTINDLNNVSKVLDSVSGLEHVSVHNLEFSVKDMEKAKNEITQKAIENAKKQADSIAKTLDVKIEGIQKVDTSTSNNPYIEENFDYQLTKAESMTMNTPISPEKLELNAKVHVVFLVKN